MNLINQILPGAVTGKNGIAKSAETPSGSEGDPDSVFALELPVHADSSPSDPDAILNVSEETANLTGETPADTESQPVPQEVFFIESSDATNDSDAALNPEKSGRSDMGKEQDPNPTILTEPAAAEKNSEPVDVEKPVIPIVKDQAGKSQAGGSQAGLLANRAGNHQPGIEMRGSAEAAQHDTISQHTVPSEPKNGLTNSSPVEMSRPGNVPEHTPAAEITPKAWGWRKSDQPMKSAKASPVMDAAVSSQKPVAADLVPAKAPNDVLPVKAPLLHANPAAANHGFTFRLAANDEMPQGSSGSSDQSLAISAVKTTQPVNTVPTVAAGARVPSLPIQNIAVEIAHRFQAGSNKFNIKLDPPELGRIDVRMEVARDGHVTAHLAAEKPETLAALSRDAGALERALNASGLDTDKNSLNFSLRQGNQGFESPDGDGQFDSGTQSETSASNDGEMSSSEQIIRGYASPTGVDLHV